MDIVMLTGIIVILLALSPKLALAIIVIITLMFYISTKLRRNIRRSWQYTRIQQSRLNSHLNESIQGIRITQSFTQEKENTEFFEGVNQDNYDSFNVAVKKSAMFSTVDEMCYDIGKLIYIYFYSFFILHCDI